MFESLAEKLKKMRETKTEDNEVTFKPYEEKVSEPAPAPAPEKVEEPVVKKAFAPIVAGADATDSNIELKIVNPSSFEDVSVIADYLLAGCTVVLNCELLDASTMVRMLDFVNGVTYSIDGDIKNVSKNTFIITPHNVDVSDDE